VISAGKNSFAMEVRYKPETPSHLRSVQLEQSTPDINELDENGDSVLHVIIKHGGPADLIIKLVRDGALVELRNRDGLTPLKLAILYYCMTRYVKTYCAVVEALLGCGADPNNPGLDGEPPLIFLIKKLQKKFYSRGGYFLPWIGKEKYTMVDLLLNHRTGLTTNPNAEDKEGKVALIHAAGDVELIGILVRHDACIRCSFLKG